MTLQRGEPLAHPEIVRLVEAVSSAGIPCTIITNSLFLLRYIDALVAAPIRV